MAEFCFCPLPLLNFFLAGPQPQRSQIQRTNSHPGTCMKVQVWGRVVEFTVPLIFFQGTAPDAGIFFMYTQSLHLLVAMLFENRGARTAEVVKSHGCVVVVLCVDYDIIINKARDCLFLFPPNSSHFKSWSVCYPCPKGEYFLKSALLWLYCLFGAVLRTWVMC